MGASNTLRIQCDYFDGKGKQCPKAFILPDDPAKNTKGVENTISTVDAHGNKLYFCGALHLVAHWVAWLKATPKEEKKSKIVAPTQEQISSLEVVGVIAPDTDDLSFKDEA